MIDQGHRDLLDSHVAYLQSHSHQIPLQILADLPIMAAGYAHSHRIQMPLRKPVDLPMVAGKSNYLNVDNPARVSFDIEVFGCRKFPLADFWLWMVFWSLDDPEVPAELFRQRKRCAHP